MSNKNIIREALEYGKQLRPRSPLFTTALAELDREEGQEPVAWIEHHKGGDNVDWHRVDHPYAKATPLYAAPPAPVSEAMSRDYSALYDLLVAGGEAFCLVDMKWKDEDKPLRDSARIRRHEEWSIDVGARGICYGDIRPYHKRNGEFKDERKELVAMCQRLSLEWLAPVDLSEILEAGQELKDIANTCYAAHGHTNGSRDHITKVINHWTAVTAKHRKP
jgi:hypothetical protein